MNSRFKDYTNKTGWLEMYPDKKDFFKITGLMLGFLGILIFLIWSC